MRRDNFALTAVVAVVVVAASACYTESQPVRMAEPSPTAPCAERPAAPDGGEK